MTYQGVLTKMQTEFANPIQYYLVFENSFLNMNQLLNKEIEINFHAALSAPRVVLGNPRRAGHARGHDLRGDRPAALAAACCVSVRGQRCRRAQVLRWRSRGRRSVRRGVAGLTRGRPGRDRGSSRARRWWRRRP